MNRFISQAVLVLAAALAGVPDEALAAPSAQASYSLNVGGIVTGDVASSQTVLGVSVGESRQAGDDFSPRSMASASASAAPGVLRFDLSSQSTTLPLIRNFTAAEASASLSWSDQIIFGGLPVGTQGSITYEILISGSGTAVLILTGRASDSGSAGMALSFMGDTAETRFSSQQNFTSGSGGEFTGLPGRVTVRRDIVFGYETDIGFSMSAGVQSALYNDGGGAGQFAGMTASFGHTVLWGGVTGVFDSGGNPVADYSLTSASGLDYRGSFASAVPEPSAVLSLLVGLALLAVRRDRIRLAERAKAQSAALDPGDHHVVLA